MIRINPKSFEQKEKSDIIHRVYTDKRYQVKNTSTGGTAKANKLSMVEIVAMRIIEELNSTNHDPAHEIVKRFLGKCFSGNVTGTAVEAYLLRKDLTEIIKSFWKCVTEVWISELQNDPQTKSKINLAFPYMDPYNTKKPSEMQLITDIAGYLSRWYSIRARVLTIKDKKDHESAVKERINIVREVINDQTLPFFDVIEKKILIRTTPAILQYRI